MRLVRSALAFALLHAAAGVISAQVPLASGALARTVPGGITVATISAGAKVTAGAKKGADTHIVMEGWVDASRVGGKRDSFPASVNGKRALRLRAAPNAKGLVLAELHAGAGIRVLETKGDWSRVRRGFWIPSAALGGSKLAAGQGAASNAATRTAAAAAAAATPVAKVTVAPDRVAEAPLPAGAMSAARDSKVLAAPGGRSVAELASGAVVEPLLRDRGWVKVRIEGWINERDLAAADSSMSTLTASDLHADPESARGKTVRWEVQILALQTADPLRRDLGRDEPYLLARGPGTENALMYLTIPPSLVTAASAIPALTNVIITARVRNGRSEPAGTAILDLKSIAKR